jgi:hypothetical protein
MLRSVLLGAGIVALLRSPMRMPLTERLFRWTWVGAPGRWLFTRAAPDASELDRIARRPTGTSSTPMRVTPWTVRVASPEVASLEARVAQLEQWRESMRSGGG